jgi:hypothetical protein
LGKTLEEIYGMSFFTDAAFGGEESEVKRDTPHPGKGRGPLHSHKVSGKELGGPLERLTEQFPFDISIAKRREV